MTVQMMVRSYLEKVNENCKKQNLDFTEFLERLHKVLEECEGQNLTISWEDIMSAIPEGVMKELKEKDGSHSAAVAGDVPDEEDNSADESSEASGAAAGRANVARKGGENEAAGFEDPADIMFEDTKDEEVIML